jgi:hypothetical protein
MIFDEASIRGFLKKNWLGIAMVLPGTLARVVPL